MAGGRLGEVRDLDVFGARLEAGVARLGARERRAGKKLVALVATERAEARGRLVEALSSERYQALLVTLQAAADSPAFVPAEVDVRESAAKQFHKLRKAMDASAGTRPTSSCTGRASRRSTPLRGRGRSRARRQGGRALPAARKAASGRAGRAPGRGRRRPETSRPRRSVRRDDDRLRGGPARGARAREQAGRPRGATEGVAQARAGGARAWA